MRRFLSMLIGLLVGLLVFGQMEAGAALVAYWKMDETGATVYDETANDNDGTISGAGRIVDGFGGYTLYFDGIDDYVSVPDSNSLDVSSAITIESWVNLSSHDRIRHVLRKENAYAMATTDEYNPNKAGVYLWGLTYPGWHWGSTQIVPDRWYHIAATYDGSNVKLYVNGKLDLTVATTGTIATTATVLYIGREVSGAADASWHGNMDEVAIYNSASTAPEIKSSYLKGLARHGICYNETASYVVFHDDNSPRNYYAKNGTTGEIEFNGTNASTVIQSALDNLTAGRTWKDVVHLKGDFLISNSINIPSNTILDLRGARLKAQNSCSIPTGRGILQNSNFPTTTANNNIEIIGGEIDGNKANNQTAFEGIFLGVVDNFVIRDVIVHDSPEVGICFYPALTGYLMNGEVRNAVSYNNAADGLQLELAIANAKGAQIRIIGGRYHDNLGYGINLRCQTGWAEPPLLEITVTNVEADHNAACGIAASLANTGLKKLIITNNYVHENTLNGIWIQEADYATVSNNIVEYNGFSGIETWVSNKVSISSNIARNNAKGTPGGSNQEAGISLMYSDDTVVADNICTDDQGTKTQKYGISIIGNVGNPVQNVDVHDNDVLGNINPILLSGQITNCKIRHNIGYVTENSGTASKANDETIAHGLAGTPTAYSATATVSRHIAIVTAVNGTNLTIGLRNDAGTAITTAENVSWHAEYRPY